MNVHWAEIANCSARRRGELIPSMLALSDVTGTDWFAADAADVKPGATVVVVGDGGTINPGKVFDLVLPLSARSSPSASGGARRHGVPYPYG